MLTPINVSNSAGSKLIFVQAIVNTTLYTVPTGKTFSGRFITTSNAEIRVNGITLYSSNSTTPATFPYEFTFPAGTVISCGGSYPAWSLIGYEQ